MTLTKVQSHASQFTNVKEVLMVFSRGSLNYGLHQEGVSDRDYVVFFAPSFEQAVLGGVVRNRTVQLDESTEYELVDVRHLVNRFDKANFSSLDFLWAYEKYVSPNAQSLYRWLLENGYSLMKQRKERLLQSTLGAYHRQVTKRLEQGQVTPKKVVQQFYFLTLFSLLLDTKTSKRFFQLAKHGNAWKTTLGSPDLMKVKFTNSPLETEELLARCKKLELEFKAMELSQDPEFNELDMTKELKNELVNLFLKSQNS